MAVLRWSNAESGGAKVLSPAALEIAALQVSAPIECRKRWLGGPTRRRSAGCSMAVGVNCQAAPCELRPLQELPLKPSAGDAPRCALHCTDTSNDLPTLPATGRRLESGKGWG